MKNEQREWAAFVNDERGTSIRASRGFRYGDTDQDVNLEQLLPRVGDYIVLGDYHKEDEEECRIVEKVFWNVQRKDIEIYTRKVDKEIYPGFKQVELPEKTYNILDEFDS